MTLSVSHLKDIADEAPDGYVRVTDATLKKLLAVVERTKSFAALYHDPHAAGLGDVVEALKEFGP